MPPYSCSLVDALPPVVTSSLADALPLFLYAGGYFAAVVVLFGGCFATVSCFMLALLGIFGDNFLCRSSSSGGFCLGGLCGESSPSVLPLLPACCISGFGRMCACLYFLFSVSFIFSPLCPCVGQVLFGRNKFVYVTAFFLMKNVLRHGREKVPVSRCYQEVRACGCVALSLSLAKSQQTVYTYHEYQKVSNAAAKSNSIYLV